MATRAPVGAVSEVAASARLRLRWLTNRVWPSGPLGLAVVAFVYYAVEYHPSKMVKVSTVLVALGVAGLISKYPVHAVTALVGLVPLSQFIYAWLFRLGMPHGLLHQAESWKELVIAGLLIAAVRSHLARPRRFDRLDWVAAAYFLFLVSYYLLPHLFTYSSLILPKSTRYIALRQDVEFVVAFMAARHAGLGRSALKQAGRALLVSGTLVALGGVWEYLSPSGWNTFVVSTLQVPRYREIVQHAPVGNTVNILNYGSGHLRVGSVFLDPIVLGPYLLIPFGLAIERIARRAAGVFGFLAAAAIGGAILLSGTRSALIGALVIAILALRPSPGRTLTTRVRFGLVVILLVIVGSPVAAGSGLIGRTTAAISGTDTSASGHVDHFHRGVHAIAVHPLGGGLGTAGNVGQRFDPTGGVTAENYYLQVGDEVGVHSMITFIALVILMLIALRRSVRGSPGMDVTGAVWISGAALAVSAVLLHIWADFTIALCFWTLAGTVIGVADLEMPSRHAEPHHPITVMAQPSRTSSQPQ